MTFTIRPVGHDEWRAFTRVATMAFGEDPDAPDQDGDDAMVEFDRTLAAFEDDRIVATALAFSLDLTLPGPVRHAAAGVSYVGVLPTHRRRGLLRGLMARQVTDLRARGEALAILSASESSIYGRFGYGPATHFLRFELSTRHAALRDGPPTSGRVRLAERDEAAELIPRLYERLCAARPGGVSRPKPMWEHYFRDRPDSRGGAGPRFYAIYEDDGGQPEGYVTYRVESKWGSGLPENVLQVMEVWCESQQARRALWHYCLNIDLIATVRSYWSPEDEPLRWMLGDPRRMNVTMLGDFLWVRLVDMAAGLAARRYNGEDSIVFEVTDAFIPENSGRYALSCDRSEAACTRTSEPADLAIAVEDLGAAYLGGVRFSALERAGRVAELRAGALRRADAMFALDAAPWCTTHF